MNRDKTYWVFRDTDPEGSGMFLCARRRRTYKTHNRTRIDFLDADGKLVARVWGGCKVSFAYCQSN